MKAINDEKTFNCTVVLYATDAELTKCYESKVYIYKNIVDKDKDMVKLGDNSIKEN